ncbi:hypothetical protein GKZ89_04015 [Bacillus mangrovi]|uniref:Cell-wall binding lipoprotein n=2 Tax=Metabacillus mangrovi TaxID=1491830 RepID=A0A7X2S2N1_9BACI|nr:hypothetical protein [Metabacillus mangrovi]
MLTGVSAAMAGTVLAGCMGPSPSEQAYEALENVVSKEAPFKKEQEPLLKLEQEENKLYNEIVALGMNDFDKIKKLSAEALELVEDRKARIASEEKSIQASEEAFKDAEEALGKIEEKEAAAEGEELQKLMNDRYDAYGKLAASYKVAAALDEELYQMFQKKDLKLEDLEAHIEKINASYKEVKELNTKFNEYTDQYNKAKKEFYSAADINTGEE